MAMQTYAGLNQQWLLDASAYSEFLIKQKLAKKPTTKPKKEEASDEAIDFPDLEHQ